MTTLRKTATALVLAFVAIIALAVATLVFRADAADLRGQLRQAEAGLGQEQDAHAQTREHLQDARGETAALQTERDSLQAERADLLTANAALTAAGESLRSERDGLQVELTEQQSENDDLAAANVALGDERDVLTQHVGKLEDRNQELFASVGRLEADNARLSAEGIRLTGEVEKVSLDRAELWSANAKLELTNAGLEASVADLETDLRRLRDAVGTVEDLEAQATAIEGEIATLNRQRAPLVPKTYNSYPACTGSMEPKITCLDTVVMLENFRPEDIVIGAVISFVDPESRTDGDRIIHRVVDIKKEGDILYFWPQGDANDIPDGYWVSEGDVYGYVTQIIKDTRPQNKELRDRVIEAEKKLAETKAALSKVEKKYCGDISTGFCHASDADYDKYKTAFNTYLDAWCDNDHAQHDAYWKSYAPRGGTFYVPPVQSYYISPPGCTLNRLT